jgi:glycosyltransferase involved in cell wall biosynthesis
LVWHVHDYVGGRPLSIRLLRVLARRCDFAVANSVSVARDLQASVPKLSVATVLNGVDVAHLSAAGSSTALDQLSALTEPAVGIVRVGLIGTFARWKGHETFLKALSELSPERVRGYVIGAPVYQTAGSQYSVSELADLASKLGVTDRVGFPGFVIDRAACLRALDIVVHASTAPEPFGLVVAEAMAAGRPVITTASGGAAELVRPGVTALTYRSGDSTSLAAAIQQLVDSPSLRSQLAEAGQLAAREQFTIDRFGQEIEEVYRQTGVLGRAA